jgi:hypothetical protein
MDYETVTFRYDAREVRMAYTLNRNAGMMTLAIWLILSGISGLVVLPLPPPLMAVLALVAGILILIGR